MIPILFDKNETAFSGNGLGRLTDCIRCEVTEERNGVYEAEFEYPIDGALFSELKEGRYIYTTHDESKAPQAFCIYFRSAPLEGAVTFRAWHISYLLNNIILEPYTAATCAQALSLMATHTINTNPFTFWTDKAVTAPYTLSVPRSVRAALGGSEGSILEVYGKGEYEFDMFTVKLYVNRGTNRGVSIRYGKNLISLDHELDAADQYAAIVPYWQSSEGDETVWLDHPVYRTGESTGRVITMDFSDSFESAPTTAQLEAKAQSTVDSTDLFEIKENMTIDFVALWQTEEYKDVANLQRIYLCDTVNIFYEKLGINATAECIKVVYDSLRERYSKMELGAPKTSLAQQILSETADKLLVNVPSKSAMQSAIDKATELISGGFGGYIKFNYLNDGTPSEMLIMNTADESTATNIIRLNQNGIGFSTDGGTTYANAWTIDGNLNADFINAGTLSGIRVEAQSGNIGRWEINSSALYKDVQGSDGYVYRVYFQPPLASGAKTWVLSCQKSQTQGNVGDSLVYDGVFILYSDGSAKFGDTNIDTKGKISLKGNASDPSAGALTLTSAEGTTYDISSNGFYATNASDDLLFALTTTLSRSEGHLSLYDTTGNSTALTPNALAWYFPGETWARVALLANSTYQQLIFSDSSNNWRATYSKDAIQFMDSNGRLRASLDFTNGLKLYDANGGTTALYPNAPSTVSVTRASLPSGFGDYTNARRIGNLVIVNFSGGITGGITDMTSVVTGLPTPIVEAFCTLVNVNTNMSYPFSVRGNSLVARATLPSGNATYWGQVVYLASF